MSTFGIVRQISGVHILFVQQLKSCFLLDKPDFLINHVLVHSIACNNFFFIHFEWIRLNNSTTADFFCHDAFTKKFGKVYIFTLAVFRPKGKQRCYFCPSDGILRWFSHFRPGLRFISHFDKRTENIIAGNTIL
jgi:hypothetical protein